MDSRFWNDSGRAVKSERYMEARAKRYADGGWKGCIVTPMRSGAVGALCVEVTPREARAAAEMIRDTHSQLARAARAAAPALIASQDVAGELYGYGYGRPDIIGELVNLVRPYSIPLAQQLRGTYPQRGEAVTRGAVDLVGDLGSILRSAAADPRLQGLATGAQSGAGTAAMGAGMAALGALGSGGGAEGAARAAVEQLGRATGLADASQAIGGAIGTALGYDLSVISPAERQARRDRALRELAMVAPTHDDRNWRGAVSYHVTNGGLYPFGRGDSESDRLLVDRSVLASLPREYPGSQPAPAPRLSQTLAQIGAQAMGSDAFAGVASQGVGSVDAQIRAVNAAAARAAESAPGAAGTALVRPQDVGAILGAEELAAQAQALAIPAAADLARRAMLGIDATAGAQLGDAQARAVLRRAIQSQSQRVRSALTIAQSLLDLRR